MFATTYFPRGSFSGAFFAGGGAGAGVGQVSFLVPYFAPVYFTRAYFTRLYFGAGRLHGAFRASWAKPSSTVGGGIGGQL